MNNSHCINISSNDINIYDGDHYINMFNKILAEDNNKECLDCNKFIRKQYYILQNSLIKARKEFFLNQNKLLLYSWSNKTGMLSKLPLEVIYLILNIKVSCVENDFIEKNNKINLSFYNFITKLPKNEIKKLKEHDITLMKNVTKFPGKMELENELYRFSLIKKSIKEIYSIKEINSII